LKPAEDALLVDTTGNTFEESVAKISQMIKEKLSNAL
jgi:cytidylate kinase